MKRLLNGILAILFLVASFPSMATGSLADSKCHVTSGTILLKNINLKLENIHTGTLLHSSQPYSVNYACYLYPSFGTNYVPTLRFTSEFGQAIRKLSDAGLGMNMTIQEDGQTQRDIPWSEIKKASGGVVLKSFGAAMSTKYPPDEPDGATVIKRHATITLELFVVTEFVQNKMLILDIPAIPAFNIVTTGNGAGGYGAAAYTGAFSIRFLPDNLGKVTVSPSVVRLGHFYTSRNELFKTAEFKVQASQKNGASTPFSVPLLISFNPSVNMTLLDETSVRLVNNGDSAGNGLKLSVRDENGNMVKFNTPVTMDTIHIGYSGSPGNVTKVYTAVVQNIPGETVKTGNFSASMSVIVTYN